LVARWKNRIGVGAAVSAADMITIANEMKPDDIKRCRQPRWRYPKFRTLLIERAGSPKGDSIDCARLGRWLRKIHGRIYDGHLIELTSNRKRGNRYILKQV
jgi:putative DNA primase/helicase